MNKPEDRTGRRLFSIERVESASVLLAVLLWIGVVTRSSGGFHDPRSATLALALLPALVATRPWRHVSRLLMLGVVATAVGAAVSLLSSPMGWAQADSPASQLLGLATLVITAAYARTAARRRAVVVVLLVALLLQFYQAWIPWWGSGDPKHLMVGTFYWHNQLAAWMLGTGLVAGAVAIRGAGRVRLVALVAVPFADAAVVLSTSRASLALLIVGHLALLVLALLSRDRARAALTAIVLPLAGAALVIFLTSTVFFPAQPSVPALVTSAATPAASEPGAGPAGDRSAASLKASGNERVAWTRAALTTWTREPLTGDGFGSFGFTSDDELPDGAVRSAFVHDAFVEGLSSGGILFGLPLVALAAAAVLQSLRRLRHAGRSPEADGVVLQGAALASLALVGHTALDFDWHYSSMVILFGVVTGMLFAHDKPLEAHRAGLGSVLTGLMAGVLLLSAGATWVEHHDRRILGASGSPLQVARSLRAGQVGPLYDERLSRAALVRSIATPATGPDQLTVPPGVAADTVRWSARGAAIQPPTQALRAEVMALLGRRDEARDLIRDVIGKNGAKNLGLYAPYAQVMALTGEYPHARPEVAAAVRRSNNASTSWRLVAAMQHLDGSTLSADTRCAYSYAGQRFGAPPPAVATIPDPVGCASAG